MVEQETSRYIDEKAADWVARLDRGPLSDEESYAFEAWLSGDPRRRGALLRASAISMLSESARALGPNFEPRLFASAPEPKAPMLSRRRLIALAGVGGVVAASVAALGISAPAAGAIITTGLGEVRLVTLDDGSNVMLNTQTGVKVHYSDAARRVELLYGEAYFTVTEDRHRPFLVEVTGAKVHTTRAMFLVRKIEGRPVDILVNQDQVIAGVPGVPAPILIQTNTQLLIPAATDGRPTTAAGMAPALKMISPDLISRLLAWREGKIAFEGEQLGQAAAEFARYSRTRIEVTDRDLAREPVTGLFAAGDPIGFSRTVAAIFNVQIDQRGGAVILSRNTARKKSP